MKKSKLYIFIAILISILFLSTAALCNQCGIKASEEKIEEKIPIPSAKIESFSKVETIQIMVRQSYIDDKTGDKIEDFSLPIYGNCKTILENIGFKAVDKSEDEYDAKLEIKINGTALWDVYLGEGGGLLYTGAKLEGDILLSVDEIDLLERNFSEIEEPQTWVVFSGEEPKYKKPSEAPFCSVGWQKHLFLLLYDIWGIEALSRSLDNEDEFIIKQAILGLVELKDPNSIDILINLLNDKKANIRSAAIEALAEKGGIEVIDPLIKMLGDERPFVRRDAAEALGKVGNASAVPALIESLKDDEDYVRRACCLALGNIGDTRAVESLIKALKDEDYNVRFESAKALGNIGDSSAIDALEEALKEDEKDFVKKACKDAIEKILGENNR